MPPATGPLGSTWTRFRLLRPPGKGGPFQVSSEKRSGERQASHEETNTWLPEWLLAWAAQGFCGGLAHSSTSRTVRPGSCCGLGRDHPQFLPGVGSYVALAIQQADMRDMVLAASAT